MARLSSCLSLEQRQAPRSALSALLSWVAPVAELVVWAWVKHVWLQRSSVSVDHVPLNGMPGCDQCWLPSQLLALPIALWLVPAFAVAVNQIAAFLNQQLPES